MLTVASPQHMTRHLKSSMNLLGSFTFPSPLAFIFLSCRPVSPPVVCSVTQAFPFFGPVNKSPIRLFHPWDFPTEKFWVGCHFRLRIFLTQGSNPHLLHWRVDSFFHSTPGSPTFSLNVLVTQSVMRLMTPWTMICKLLCPTRNSQARTGVGLHFTPSQSDVMIS